jgi:tetratricopeptide (TPR) repeat protein
LDEAATHLATALALARRLGNARAMACLLRSLRVVNRERGALTESSVNFAEALRLTRTVGPGFVESSILVHMGILYVQLRKPQARELLTEGLEIYRGRGSIYGQATALRGLGELCLAEGRIDAALDNLSRSITLWRQLVEPFGLATSLHVLSRAHAARGEHQSAREASREASELFMRAGNHSAAREAARTRPPSTPFEPATT